MGTTTVKRAVAKYTPTTIGVIAEKIYIPQLHNVYSSEIYSHVF